MVIKTILASVMAGGSYSLIAVGSELGSIPMQLTALGFFGVAVLYVIARIVPEAMRQRQQESQAFVQSIAEMTDKHAKEINEARVSTQALIKDIHDSTLTERREWAKLMRDAIQVQTRTHEVMGEVSQTLRRCNLIHNGDK